MKVFANRVEAGRELGQALVRFRDSPKLLVLGLPRGGVPVGFEVAESIGAPLDVLVVRKLGMPGQPELAMGAIASGGAKVINEDVVRWLSEADEVIEDVARKETEEVRRRELAYRGDRPPFDAHAATVILVDDGIATGATMRAAVRAVRQLEPAKLIVATPTAAVQACAMLEQEADEVVCLDTPEPFVAVGCWYREFPQTSDEEVRALLARAQSPTGKGH